MITVSPLLRFLFITLMLVSCLKSGFSQTSFQPNGFTSNQPVQSYLSNSSAFKQEIARMEVNVLKEGKAAMPITQVPRLEKGDVLKIRLLDEPVNGLKPDQSNFNWTLLVAYINPGRNIDKASSVSEEIQFRRTGWYKEYSFAVPYDSQPIFFLYPKPNYRSKILKLINQNQDEIRKIGEKTIEIADAYAKIGSFLNELQSVISRNQAYPGSGAYGSSYGYYGSNSGYNQNPLMDQMVERLARSFNIQLPSCWQSGAGAYGAYTAGNTSGAYTSGAYTNSSYTGGYGTSPGTGSANDFIGRAQCVAKSVRIEDFDLSVSRMIQQGGILAASQLAQKYPQIAFWINIAAAAVDFILKLTNKTPLRLVPTVTSTVENPAPNQSYQSNQSYQPNYAQASFAPGSAKSASGSVRISLFAEASPSDNGFVTAYPVVVQKWQANADPETINLPMPSLMEDCLHAGQNILKSTDLMNDWIADAFAKDFKLAVDSPAGGFHREFSLKKNVGLGGWELNLTEEDLSAFSRNSRDLGAVITGKRGFSRIKTVEFKLPPSSTLGWEIDFQARIKTANGATINLKNRFGNCKCLRAVVLKTPSGNQLNFEPNTKENPLLISDDGSQASLEIKTADLANMRGAILELRMQGGGTVNLPLDSSPASSPVGGTPIIVPMTTAIAGPATTVAAVITPATAAGMGTPVIVDLKLSKGANRGTLTGERLDLVQYVRINGLKARLDDPRQNLQNPNSKQGAPQNNSQRTFVFENPDAMLLTETVSLVLAFKNGQTVSYPQTFKINSKTNK